MQHIIPHQDGGWRVENVVDYKGSESRGSYVLACDPALHIFSFNTECLSIHVAQDAFAM
jgi:hypothetical protein